MCGVGVFSGEIEYIDDYSFGAERISVEMRREHITQDKRKWKYYSSRVLVATKCQ